MITLKSSGIIAGLFTAIGGATGSIIYSIGLFDSTKQKITEILDKENKYALLSTESTKDQEDWKTSWEAYKRDNLNKTKGQDKWTIEGWGQTALNEVPKEFKVACKKRKTNEDESINDSNYTDFIKYCTKPKTIQEALSKFGFKALGGDNQQEEWKKRLEKYKQSNNQLPNTKINNTENNKTFSDLKKGCEDALNLRTNYEKTVKAIKEWCSESFEND